MSKINKEEYIENIKKIYGDKYTLVSDFIDTQHQVTIKCNICGSEYNLIANEFTRNREKNRKRFINGCDHCRLIKNTEEIKEKVLKLTNNKIKIIDNNLISSNRKIIKMKCNICGYEFNQCIHVLENNLKKSKNKNNFFGCAICSKKKKKNTEIYKKEVYSLVKDEYSVIGEYINTNCKIKMKHNICGCEWDIRPDDFINNNNRCPKCANLIISNGFNFINKYLSENNISYELEKTFDNCKKNKLLPFDFYLPEYNLLLEYDGEQHFKHSFDRTKKDKLKKQHERDLIKNKYCLDNKINLIRFKYTLSINDIKEILDKLFNDNLTINDYKLYNIYVIDIEEDTVYNNNKYYNNKDLIV